VLILRNLLEEIVKKRLNTNLKFHKIIYMYFPQCKTGLSGLSVHCLGLASLTLPLQRVERLAGSRSPLQMGVPGLFAIRIQPKNRCNRGSPVSMAIFLRCQARTNQMVAIQRHHHQVFPSIQSDPPVLQCCEDRSAPKWRRIAAFGAGIANCVPH